MGYIAASVLLKLLINANEKCHITYAPWCMSGTLYFQYKHHTNDTIHDPREPEKYHYIKIVVLFQYACTNMSVSY